MAKMQNLFRDYDGVGLADLVQDKQVRPVELVDASVQAIESLNPKLNAVIHTMYEQARQQAARVEEAVQRGDAVGAGPLAGVPMVLKDTYHEVEGEPVTYGSRAWQGNRATQDALYVQKLRAAGALFLGMTNMPEFALMAITEPKHYGPTRNPWDPNVTPGGSSGGSAVAVATGMVPIAGGSDGGGSIRIPAAYCGLFGLKPTRGRTPVGPQLGRHWQGASASHVLTRTVRDSARVLDVLAGTERYGAFTAPAFDRRYFDVLQQPFERPLRIAYSTASPLGTEVDADCIRAVEQTAQLLAALGHHVEQKDAPVDGRSIAQSFIMMYFGEVGAELRELGKVHGRKVRRRDVEPTSWLLASLGESLSAAEFVASMKEWDRAAYQMESFHDTYDLYLTPTTAMPPARIGELELKPLEKLLAASSHRLGIGKLLKKVGLVDVLVETSLKRTPFTQLANLTGQPAMSVPLYQTSAGLPLGVQFVAPRGREDVLLRLAAQLEATDQWLDVRRNPLFVG